MLQFEMFGTLSKLAKFLFINEDKVYLNAEDLKSPSKTAGVAGVKKTDPKGGGVFYTASSLENTQIGCFLHCQQLRIANPRCIV